MSHSQPFFNYNYNNHEADDSSAVFAADTVMPDKVPSLPPASQEESSQSFTSVLLRRINSRHRPAEPSTTTATATVYDANTVMPDQEESPARSEDVSTNQSSSSSSSKKRPIITNSSSQQSTKRPRQSSRLKRQQPQDQSCVDKSDSEVEDENEHDEAVINQSSSSSSSQTSATKTKQQIQNEARWKSNFEELRAYKQLHGHTCVPRSNKQLGLWVVRQRAEYKKLKKNGKGKITHERIQTLESIGFEWELNKGSSRNESAWNKQFNELKEYKEKYNDTNVPRSENKKLGKWVCHQRQEYKKFKKNEKSQITRERIKTLESIDFEWVAPNQGGPRNDSSWNKRFNELKQYKEKYGRTDVPHRYEDNKELGVWVGTQRYQYKKFKKDGKGKITPERIDLLNSIGFEWECRPVPAPHS